MLKYSWNKKKIKVEYKGVLVFLFLDLVKGCLVIFSNLILFKKHCWHPYHSGGSCESILLPRSSIHGGVGSCESSTFRWCDACSRRRSGWAAMKFFFFPLSFLFHALKIHANPFKKQLYSPICNFIDFGTPYFDCYYFAFDVFFYSILVHFNSFHFFIQFDPSTFYWFISMFYTFLDIIFLQFHPLSFHCIYFLIQF